MGTEKANDSNDKSGGTDFSCNPQDCNGMFEMMDKFCSAQGQMSDCSAMMKAMMEKCCGPKAENSKSEKQQK
ncbi:MAG: hypothetical protein JSU83_01840 [Deltaproteobacteria bacterium]|nr:MAG: hypothetical protein JSU83_01840 [Deltaproteobacteria bacterium]